MDILPHKLKGVMDQFTQKVEHIRSENTDVFDNKTILGSVDAIEDIVPDFSEFKDEASREFAAELTVTFADRVRFDVAQLYHLAQEAIRADVEGDEAKILLDGLQGMDPLLAVAGIDRDGVSHQNKAVTEYLEDSFDFD